MSSHLTFCCNCDTLAVCLCFVSMTLVTGIGLVRMTCVSLPLYVYSHVHKAGGLCIVDEVQTGFGRGGEYFWIFPVSGWALYTHVTIEPVFSPKDLYISVSNVDAPLSPSPSSLPSPPSQGVQPDIVTVGKPHGTMDTQSQQSLLQRRLPGTSSPSIQMFREKWIIYYV